LPKGDVLIHAGDITYKGKRTEVEDFLTWFDKQKFAYKVFIGGNHDFFLEKEKKEGIEKMIPQGITYLNDSGITIDNIKLWGSPVTPKFFNWAFNRKRGDSIKKHWSLIPESTTILITHGPCYGILDQVASEEHVGDKDLLARIREVKPKVHLFGHIHESYGTTKSGGVHFINASLMNENYELVHKPTVFDL
jgi:Icc-related predicted phosphoesterase